MRLGGILAVLAVVGVLEASGACVGNTDYNATAPNRLFTRAYANPKTGRALLHYVVPAGTAGVMIYAHACYGNISFSKFAHVLPSWNSTPDWVPTATLPKRGFKLVSLFENGLVYLTVRADPISGELAGFENANTSGIIDVLMTNSFTDMEDLVPVPGAATANNDSSVTTKLQISKGKAVVTWATTGDARDSYKVYRYDLAKKSDWGGMMPPPGMFLTACSYKCWMKLDATATKAITFSGSFASTTVSGLSKRNVTLVAVVAERANGYQASYQMIALNAAHPLGPLPQLHVIWAALLAAFLALCRF